MAQKTVEDLKAVREALDAELLKAAYALTGGLNQRSLDRLVQLDQAICALDTLIAEGRPEPA
jgi:hypothetical protein